MKNLYIIKIILLFILTCNANAQNDLKFHNMSPKGGLSYNGVKDIKQDGIGYLWVLLDKNIYRFDGHSYNSYKINFTKKLEKNDPNFNNFTTDNEGSLYVSTNSGVYKFNNKLDMFEKIVRFDNKYVYIDNKDVLWLLHSSGVSFLSEDNKIENLNFKPNEYTIIQPIFCEINKFIIVFSNNGKIFTIDTETKEISLYSNIQNELQGSILIDAKLKKNDIWLLTSDFSLIKVDISTSNVTYKYKYSDNSDIEARTLLISNDDKLWVGTLRGLFILNLETMQLEHHQHNPKDKFSLPHNSVWRIKEDNYGDVWIGTYMGSIAYVNKYDKKIFETHYISSNGLQTVPVSGFATSENLLWISTEGGGINVFDRNRQSYSYLLNDSTKENCLSSNNTKSLIKTGDDLWISTFRGGLNQRDLKSGRYIHFRKNTNYKNSLFSDNIRKIVLESDSGLWIIYQQQTDMISFLSFKDKNITHLSTNADSITTQKTEYIYDIYRSMSSNKLWFITSKTLFELNIFNNKIKKYNIPSATNSGASTLCEDDNALLWIGTFGNELLSFDPVKETFHSYANILKSDIAEIYSINHSNENRVWLGTNDGLVLFDSETQETAIFYESDGTQGNVYYPLATIKDDEGYLYFGGTGGYTIVNPKNVTFNPIKPKVFITDFYIDNLSVLGDSNININTDFITDFSPLTLKHNQRNFGFRFSSDNYLNTDKNEFRYRLSNFYDRWSKVDASGRVINFTKVPAGKYRLEFQAANNDGVWGDIYSFEIIRKKAPWITTPALIFYSLIIALIFYIIITNYLKRKQLEYQVHLDKIEVEKREEIHQNQLQFFTNISHDLKTPLSLIMATVNRLREEGMKEYYYKILKNNTERLHNLLNDILDYRKIQTKSMKLSVNIFDINEFIKTIVDDFENFALNKNIVFKVNLNDENLTKVPFDKVIMEKILMNLITNSLKYTPNGGEVKISASTIKFKSKYKYSYTICENKNLEYIESFQIVINDTGVGISKNSISQVFERFYRIEQKNESKHLGSGIGLALVKDLVLLHKGCITIYSERNVGSDFILEFPLSISNYLKKDFKAIDIDTLDTEENIEVIKKENCYNEVSVEYKKDSLNEKTILLAEDNTDLRAIIKISLKEKYEVIDFEDAKPALEYLKQKDVDLIISDIMMPQLDGITFCKLIKEDKNTSHIPFVMLTAKSGLESKLEGAESGADLYFEKPIDLSLLKSSIKNIFNKQDALREHYANSYFANVSEVSTNKEDSKFLTELTLFMDDHIDESNLNVNNLAQEMSMSRSKLYSKIKSLTGKSIVEFILSYRLKKAAKLLIENNLNIQDVMYSVGIESQSYFSKAFKKEFGLTPSKFVSQHKLQND